MATFVIEDEFHAEWQGEFTSEHEALKFSSRPPERRELIVFRFPADPDIKYVKRVIGLPRDQVEMKNGAVLVNGTPLDEPYIKSENNVRTAKDSFSLLVPEGEYFVLGDNRDRSNDSRYWGFLPSENIHGSVEFVWFSFDPQSGVRGNRIGKYVN